MRRYGLEGFIGRRGLVSTYLGLKSDGTVVTAGDNSNGQCDVSGWRDIIAISCVDWLTIGLKSDGSVVITGHDSIYGWNLGEWPGE